MMDGSILKDVWLPQPMAMSRGVPVRVANHIMWRIHSET